MPVSSVPHLPSTISLALSTIPHYTPVSLCFALSMCVCLTYCCLFKLQFVNMRECVCLWLRHTPTKPHTAYRSSSIRPNFFSDTNTQLYLCLLRCLSLSPFSGLRGGLTIKLLVQSLTAHNLGQPVLRPNLADIVGPLVYPFPLTFALPSVQQQKQLGKEWGGNV